MSKKIESSNSPFPWNWFPENAVSAWVDACKADYLPDGRFRFREGFELKIQNRIREDRQFALMVDDKVPRRYVTQSSGGHRLQAAKQLRPIAEVGTDSHVTKRRDMLTRRRFKQSAADRELARGISVWNGEDPDEFATHRPGEVRC